MVTCPLPSTSTAAPGGRSQPTATTAPCTSSPLSACAVTVLMRCSMAGERNCCENAAICSGVFRGAAVLVGGPPPAAVSEIRWTFAPAGDDGPDDSGAEEGVVPGSCAAGDDEDEPHAAGDSAR